MKIEGPVVEVYADNNEEINDQEEVEVEEIKEEEENEEKNAEKTDEQENEDKAEKTEDNEVVEDKKENKVENKENKVENKEDKKTDKKVKEQNKKQEDDEAKDKEEIKPLAEEGKDLGSSIFTDVKIEMNGQELEEGTTEIEITDGLQLGFTFDWELSDDLDLNAGDWAQMKLPDQLHGIPGQTTGPLHENGVEVGTYDLTEDGYLRVEFNDELTEKSDRSGKVGFLLEFDVTKFEDDVNQSIKFEEPINKEFIIKAKPGGEVHDIKKFGAANGNINPEYLNWTI